MYRNGHFSPNDHVHFEDRGFYESLEESNLQNFETIPSIKTLILLDQFTFDDKHIYERSIFEQVEHLDYNLKPLKKDKFEKMELKSR